MQTSQPSPPPFASSSLFSPPFPPLISLSPSPLSYQPCDDPLDSRRTPTLPSTPPVSSPASSSPPLPPGSCSSSSVSTGPTVYPSSPGSELSPSPGRSSYPSSPGS